MSATPLSAYMLGENLCLLSEAAAKIPTRPNVSTVWRHNKGIKGIRLETIRIGGTIYTSDEAIARFLETINDPPPRSPPAPAAKLLRPWRAERILKRSGV